MPKGLWEVYLALIAMYQNRMLSRILQNLHNPSNIFQRVDTSSTLMRDDTNPEMVDSVRLDKVSVLGRVRLIDKRTASKSVSPPF